MSILSISAKGIVPFAIYFVAASALFAVFLALYVRITPYREFELIRRGNVAAALSLSGAMIGFTLPLASAIAHAVVVEEMLMWGSIALVVQLLVYLTARRVFPELTQRIPEGCAAHGLLLGSLSLSAGILNAACMVY
jgi:putative membrane protein